MYCRLSSAAIIAIAVVQAPSSPGQSAWRLPDPATTYTATATGAATDAAGAALTLTKSAAPGSGTSAAEARFGVVSATVPAEMLRGKRVTLRGELQTRDAGGASLWMRIDRSAGMLMLDNGQDRAVKGDAEWAPFAVTLPVPSSASAVVIGLMLQGAGSVSARAVRLETGPALRADGPIASDAKAVVDAAIGIVRKNAWMRDNIDWTVVEPEVRLLAAGADKSADVYPAVRYLLASLNDRHSFLMPPAATTAFRTGGAANPPIDVKALGDRIGYVNVPGYGGAEAAAARKFATDAHERLAATVDQAGCGWIVDLRGNTGGNMWPMLAGLKPFLGNEPLGTFVSRENTSPPWRAGQAVGVEPPEGLRKLEQAWVAVLTGPRTASSGEAVTIAFKGRPHTRSFGQPTNGLSSANGTFPLPDGAMILLTTAIEADRTGKQYGEKVDPDEIIPAPAGAPPSISMDDPTMAAAMSWLKRSCGPPSRHALRRDSPELQSRLARPKAGGGRGIRLFFRATFGCSPQP
jgi:C-terminal processing protease CtpA/Prc